MRLVDGTMMVSVVEAAEMLGLSYATMNARVDRGALPRPTHSLGKARFYYSEPEVNRLCRILTQLNRIEAELRGLVAEADEKLSGLKSNSESEGGR